MLFSKTVLTCYKELLFELYGIDIDINEINEKLTNFRNNHKIYFVDMEEDLYSLTLYDSTIFINKEYLNYYHKSINFIVFLTLFHEYSHILSRLVRGDKDYFYDTGEFLKNNTNKYLKYTEESGHFFRREIII